MSSTKKRTIATLSKNKRRSDTSIGKSSIDRGWAAFGELYETSETAKQRRKSAESVRIGIDIDIGDSDLTQKKRSPPNRSSIIDRPISRSTNPTWGVFDELLETSEAAKTKRKNEESRAIEIDESDLSFDRKSIEALDIEIDNSDVSFDRGIQAVDIDIKDADESFDRNRDRSPIDQGGRDRSPIDQHRAIAKNRSSRLIPRIRSPPSAPEPPPKVQFPKNGLANRLSILLQKQRSDLSIWSHRMKVGTQIGPTSMEIVLKRKIYADDTCVTYEGENRDKGKIVVIFGRNTWREYELKEEKTVKIYAPYLRLESEKFSMPVIVGPMFLQVLD